MAGVAALFALGIALGRWVPADPFWLGLASSVTCVTALALGRHHVYWLAVTLVLAGWTGLAREEAVLTSRDLRESSSPREHLAVVLGTLEETPEVRIHTSAGRTTTNTRVVLRAQHLILSQGTPRPVSGRVWAVTRGVLDSTFHRGRSARVHGVLQEPRGPIAPGLFDLRQFLLDRGIYRELRVASPDDWELTSVPYPQQLPWEDRFQSWARRILAQGLPVEDDELRLLWAMVLGWKTALVDELQEPFLRSGTLHVFAISGLHVALIAQALVQALRLFCVPRFAAGLLALPAIWLYVAATGWQASAVRSAIMSSVVIASWMCSRPVDVLNSLATSAFAVLAWDPLQLFQAGFQLSFSVVAAIGLLAPSFSNRLQGVAEPDPFLPDACIPAWRRYLGRAAHRVLSDIAISGAASLGSLPLSAWHFHLVAPAGLIANLAVVPLSSFALASSLASLACGDWLPSLGECFNHGSWFWMKSMLAVSRWSANVPLGAWNVQQPPLACLAGSYFVMAAIHCHAVHRPRPRNRWLGLGFASLAIAGIQWQLSVPQCRVAILPLGSGHSICIESGSNTSMVDSGDAYSSLGVVHPFLRSRGINHLNALWLSHGDIRHVGGASNLASLWHPPSIHIGPTRFRSSAYRSIVDELRARCPDSIRPVRDGDLLGPCRVVHPREDDRFSQADDASLVLLFNEGPASVLLLGDLGREGQEILMRRHPELRASIVISGIPTKGEPLCDGLLEQLKPRLVIIADSARPPTARLGTTAQARLLRSRIPLRFTSETGSLDLYRNSGRWEVRTATGTAIASFADPIPRPIKEEPSTEHGEHGWQTNDQEL